MASGNALHEHFAASIKALLGQKAQVGDQHQALVGFAQGFRTFIGGAALSFAFAFVVPVVLRPLLRGFRILLLVALGFGVKSGDAE